MTCGRAARPSPARRVTGPAAARPGPGRGRRCESQAAWPRGATGRGRCPERGRCPREVDRDEPSRGLRAVAGRGGQARGGTVGRGGLQQTILCASRNSATARASPASALISVRRVMVRRDLSGTQAVSRYAAVRSAAPPGDGGGMRPQEARAARLKPSAACCSSGLPVACAAAVRTSAAAQAMSADCAAAGRRGAGGPRRRLPPRRSRRCPGCRRRRRPQGRAGCREARPASGGAALAGSAARPASGRRTRPAGRWWRSSGQADRVPGHLGGWLVPWRSRTSTPPPPGRRRNPARPGPRPRTCSPRGAALPGPTRQSSRAVQPRRASAAWPSCWCPGGRARASACRSFGNVRSGASSPPPYQIWSPAAVTSPGRPTAYPVTSPGWRTLCRSRTAAHAFPGRRRTRVPIASRPHVAAALAVQRHPGPARTGRSPSPAQPGRPFRSGPVGPSRYRAAPYSASRSRSASPIGSSRCADAPVGSPAAPASPRCGCGCHRGGPPPTALPSSSSSCRGQPGARA